jgi:Ni,Fe-hydrogenase maturation factor
MKPLLIVGLGNPLMGDDGVGAVLAESLAGHTDADLLIGGTDLLRCAPE